MKSSEFKFTDIKVLVVDDHDPIRKAMKRLLSGLGIDEVCECSDGSEALEIIKNTHIDLILTDLYMRNVSGFDLLSAVRNRMIGSDIPVICVTGEAKKGEIVLASDLGADGYILKPFQAEEFHNKIQTVMTNYRNPSEFFANLRAGDKALLAGEYEEAKKQFISACEKEPESQRAKHSLAFTLLRVKKAGEAIKILNENIEKNDQYFRNYATLADVYLAAKKPVKALKNLKKELALNPKQPNRHVLAANIFRKIGQLEGAKFHYREALKINAKNRAALVGMAKTLAQLQDIEKAVYYIKRVRRNYPGDTATLELGVKLFLGQKMDKKAEFLLRDEHKRNPKNPESLLILINLLNSWERFEEANDYLSTLLRLFPKNSRAMKIAVDLYLRQKQTDLAIEALRKLVTVEVSSATLVRLAKLLIGKGKYVDAINQLNRSLGINRENAVVFFYLGVSYSKTNQYGKARLCFIQAQKYGMPVDKLKEESAHCLYQINQRKILYGKQAAS